MRWPWAAIRSPMLDRPQDSGFQIGLLAAEIRFLPNDKYCLAGPA